MPMKKRLVVCCDGTWNKAETRTSISRLHDMVVCDATCDDGIEQRCVYVQGVGANRFTRFRGGLFGVGLSDNILEAYRWLVDHYGEGDDIFCFGFSRGAYTARSLCGLIGAAGLLRPADAAHVKDAFEYYRTRPDERQASKLHGRLQKLDRHTAATGLKVKMLGVFDTVGSLGVPVPLFASLTQWRRVAFHDTCLSALIENAYHALAIDEQRGPFEPTLWTDVARDGSGEVVGQTVVQAWFPGVHSDVGGGYQDKSLADVPFAWMLAAACQLGLVVDWAHGDAPRSPDPCGSAHDSLNLGWKIAEWWPWLEANGPRVIGNRARQAKGLEAIAAPEFLHAGVLERLADEHGKVPKSQRPYRPGNVADRDGKVHVDLEVIRTPPPFMVDDAAQ
jgi:uncharacterized protein (DUF2235 family)